MFIIDRKYLQKQRSNLKIHRTSEIVRVRDIDNKWHDIFEYVMLNFYIFDEIFVDK